MVQRLEWLHQHDFVHRDMKPENILLSPPTRRNQLLHLIDFGLSKRWRDPATGKHVSNKQKGVIGTVKFLSYSTHCGMQHGRKDDLEALGLMMIYFLNGG